MTKEEVTEGGKGLGLPIFGQHEQSFLNVLFNILVFGTSNN